MWRAIPLLKMAARMVILSVGLVLAAHVIVQIVVAGGFLRIDALAIAYISRAGAVSGLSLAIPMLLVTVVFFREIRQATLYRMTMLTVALITAVALWLAPILEEWPARIGQDTSIDKHIAIIIGFSALHVLMSNYVAGVYIRDSNHHQLQAPEQTATDPSSKRT